MVEKLKTLSFPFLDHESEMKIGSEFLNYLSSIQKEYLYDNLSYVLKEMIGNANKANMKRVHFDINELDIGSSNDYEKGIKTFHNELMENYSIYSSSAQKLGYFVRVDLYISKGFLVLLISNNNQILPVEKKRIEDKINNTARFTTFEEALVKGLDTEESAGFGIILSIMMLRKIGLDDRFLKLMGDNSLTQVKIAVPLTLMNKEEGDKIADEIVKEIEEIPQFPEHISDLQKILNDPNTNFSIISKIVGKDPSLIADLLKIANSAFYMLPKKVHTIEEAIRLIGFKGIRNLVVTYSTRNILMNKFNLNVIKVIMEHSYEVAYYAYEIAKKLKLKKIIDDVYLGGILHDFGKIIINSMKPGIMDKIKKICNEKGIDRDIMENLTNGYNHSIIGSRLAQKWNFPDNLNETIMYHHIPLEAKDDNLDLVFIIYLADIFYYYKRKEYGFNYINNKVLERYNLTDQKDFDDFFKYITIDFKKRKDRI